MVSEYTKTHTGNTYRVGYSEIEDKTTSFLPKNNELSFKGQEKNKMESKQGYYKICKPGN